MAIAPVAAFDVRPAALAAEPSAKQKALKNAVDEVVGSVFFGEMFRAMRQSTLKGEYGHGGRGEEIFTAQLHGVLAKGMARNAKLGINDALYRHLAQGL